MTFRDYWRILRQRWRVLASVMALAVFIAVLLALITTPVYQARVQVFVTTNNQGSDSTQQYTGAAFTLSQVSTYAAIVDSPDVLNAVRRQLNIDLTDEQLKSEISATSPTQQSLVNIYVQDGNAQSAADIANAAATGFIDTVEKYATPTGSSRSAVRLFITDPATTPAAPIKPQPVLNVAIGVFFGLLVGASAALMRDALDNRLKDVDAVEKLIGAPSMGVVVDDPSTADAPVAARSDSTGMRAENFRHIRANLQFAQIDDTLRVLAVTSSMPGEGKTTVAINVATTMAQAGYSVCLVDADLRRPSVAPVLGLIPTVGLTSIFLDRIPLADALQSSGKNLSVLTSGPTPPNPSELLGSDFFSSVINALMEMFDYVVVDSAPVLPVADAAEVASLADGTLLVTRHGHTTDNQIRRTAESLRRVDATILGFVMNRVPVRANREYGYAYYHQDAAPTEPRKRGRGGRGGSKKAKSSADGTKTESRTESRADERGKRQRRRARAEDAGSAASEPTGAETFQASHRVASDHRGDGVGRRRQARGTSASASS